MGDAFAGVEKMIRKTFLPHIFFEKKTPLTHCRISKYDINQDGRTGTPESIYVSEGGVPKLSEGKRGSDLVRDRGRGFLQSQLTTDARGRKARWEEILGSRKHNQTQGFSLRPQRYQQAPNSTGKKHRCLAERTR